MDIRHKGRSARRANRGPALVFWLFLGIAAFYLLSEHRAHIVTSLYWLPLLLFLACPLMHVLGHGGHGHRRERTDEAAGDPPPATPDAGASPSPSRDRPGGEQP